MKASSPSPPSSPPPEDSDGEAAGISSARPPSPPTPRDPEEGRQVEQRPLFLRRLSSRASPPPSPPPPPAPPAAPTAAAAAAPTAAVVPDESPASPPAPPKVVKRVRFADQQPRPLPFSPAWCRGVLRVLLSPTERRTRLQKARYRMENVLRGRSYLVFIVLLTLYVLVGTFGLLLFFTSLATHTWRGPLPISTIPNPPPQLSGDQLRLAGLPPSADPAFRVLNTMAFLLLLLEMLATAWVYEDYFLHLVDAASTRPAAVSDQSILAAWWQRLHAPSFFFWLDALGVVLLPFDPTFISYVAYPGNPTLLCVRACVHACVPACLFACHRLHPLIRFHSYPHHTHPNHHPTPQ
jgi:hypothetical protein